MQPRITRNGEPAMRKINITITQKQFEWLMKKKIYSPSRILQREIDELISRDP